MNIMIYTVEKPLSQFEFWSGAKDTAAHFTEEQLNQLDDILSDAVPDENYTEDYINNLFWFENDYIASLLGFDNFEALVRHNDGDDDDEDDWEEDDEEEDEIGPGMESEFEDAKDQYVPHMTFQDLFTKEGGAANDET